MVFRIVSELTHRFIERRHRVFQITAKTDVIQQADEVGIRLAEGPGQRDGCKRLARKTQGAEEVG